MLSWLAGGAGAAQSEGETSAFQDQPETPAHVFAARAFKYRLWGTPKPDATAVKTRARARDTKTNFTSSAKEPENLFLSPSKPNGILLTPGTTNLRRSKTVTFGAQQRDARQAEDAGLSRRNSTNTVPGKFPTPSRIELTVMDEQEVSTRPRTSLTEKLHNARAPKGGQSQTAGPVEVSVKVPEAKTEAKKVSENLKIDEIDWKQRYEQYSTRTEKEMRKLIAKQQAAKHFARDKDSKTIELTEQLRFERKRTERLEARINELTARVAELDSALKQQTQPAAEQGQTVKNSDRKPETSLETRFNAIRPRTSPEKHAKAIKTEEGVPHRSKASRPVEKVADIWAEAVMDDPASPVRITRHQKPVSKTLGEQNDDNPLRQRDINTVTSTTPPNLPPQSTRQPTQQTPVRPQSTRKQTKDSRPPGKPDLDLSFDLPQPSPEQSLLSIRHPTSNRVARTATIPTGQAILPSSPFISTPPRYDPLALPYSVSTPRNDRKDDVFERKATTMIAEKENAVPFLQAETYSPRKTLDDERRAKAAARIAARKRERERSRGKLGA